MTIINDYTSRIAAEQRQHDLWAEAASHRLAASVRGDRPMWWRRLLPDPRCPRREAAAPSGATVPSQPIPC